MKKQLINLSILTVIILAACGQKPDNLQKKKAELAELKASLTTLEDKIKTVEAEISKLDTSNKSSDNLEIKTLDITAQNFKTYIEVQGRIDAEENVSLSTQAPGVITKIHVKPGDMVSKGQVLAETDASATLMQISDLETSLNLAKQAFQKQENLWKQNIGTEMQYLQAKTNKESLEKKISTMGEQVRMSKIISPISGTVDAVNIKIAQMVSPGMNAITIVNYNNLKVKAELAESYSSRIKSGNTTMIYFPDINDSILAKVNYSSRAINPMTRTFSVEILLPNSNKYHPNMVAKLKINDYISSKPVIVVPVKFIQKGPGESFVLVENDGVVHKKVITINKEYNGLAEIASGLSEGDKLIVEGYDLVNEGEKVTVKK